MAHLNRQEYHQACLDRAIDQLGHFFEMLSNAEDTQQTEALILYDRECRRWGLIASIILSAGVNVPEYADN